MTLKIYELVLELVGGRNRSALAWVRRSSQSPSLFSSGDRHAGSPAWFKLEQAGAVAEEIRGSVARAGRGPCRGSSARVSSPKISRFWLNRLAAVLSVPVLRTRSFVLGLCRGRTGYLSG